MTKNKKGLPLDQVHSHKTTAMSTSNQQRELLKREKSEVMCFAGKSDSQRFMNSKNCTLRKQAEVHETNV